MSVVKELTLSPDGTVADPEPDEEDDEPDEVAGADEDVVEDDEQPAAIRAATPARAIQPNRGRGLFLLPSSMLYTFRRNASGYAVVTGTAEHVCPYVTDGRCCGDWTSRSQSRKKVLMNGRGPDIVWIVRSTGSRTVTGSE
jgi:hypothetical protein